MCLASITKTFYPPDPEVRRAWKIVEYHDWDGELYPIYRNNVIPYQYFWQTCAVDWAAEQTHDFHPVKYIPGYHCFATKEDALKARELLAEHSMIDWESTRRLVEVEIKDILYEGTDATSTTASYVLAKIKVVVARQIRLIESEG